MRTMNPASGSVEGATMLAAASLPPVAAPPLLAAPPNAPEPPAPAPLAPVLAPEPVEPPAAGPDAAPIAAASAAAPAVVDAKADVVLSAAPAKFADKTLRCGRCTQPFLWSGDQQARDRLALTEMVTPRLCPTCREAARADRRGWQR